MIQLPEPLFRGRSSALMVSEMVRTRDEHEDLGYEGHHAGYEKVGAYFVPPFQRPAVWSPEQQRRLVESLHLNISIGSIVVTGSNDADPVTGRAAITCELLIDGQQRLRALTAYMHSGLRIFLGTPYEHCWDELDVTQQRLFRSKPVGYIEIEEGDMETLRELYNRLNFGGTAHTEDQRA